MLYSICSYTLFIFILYDIWWLRYTRHSPNVLHMHITFNTTARVFTAHSTLADCELMDTTAPPLCPTPLRGKGVVKTHWSSLLWMYRPTPKTLQGQKLQQKWEEIFSGGWGSLTHKYTQQPSAAWSEGSLHGALKLPISLKAWGRC